MVLIWIILWLACAAGAYLLIELAAISLDRQFWDKAVRRFALAAGIVLGPVMLGIALELLLLAEVGKGIAAVKYWRYKD